MVGAQHTVVSRDLRLRQVLGGDLVFRPHAKGKADGLRGHTDNLPAGNLSEGFSFARCGGPSSTKALSTFADQGYDFHGIDINVHALDVQR
jgi:hypothetical protein